MDALGSADRPIAVGLPRAATVLVLDPDPLVGIALMTALSDRGFNVVTWLSTRPMPADLLALDPPRAAVIDPGRDGAGLSSVRWMQARHRPVLIHSAVVPVGVSRQGGEHWIGKPVTPSEVVDALLVACAAEATAATTRAGPRERRH